MSPAFPLQSARRLPARGGGQRRTERAISPRDPPAIHCSLCPRFTLASLGPILLPAPRLPLCFRFPSSIPIRRERLSAARTLPALRRERRRAPLRPRHASSFVSLPFHFPSFLEVATVHDETAHLSRFAINSVTVASRMVGATPQLPPCCMAAGCSPGTEEISRCLKRALLHFSLARRRDVTRARLFVAELSGEPSCSSGSSRGRQG